MKLHEIGSWSRLFPQCSEFRTFCILQLIVVLGKLINFVQISTNLFKARIMKVFGSPGYKYYLGGDKRVSLGVYSIGNYWSGNMFALVKEAAC